jgi:hypothetical protein
MENNEEMNGWIVFILSAGVLGERKSTSMDAFSEGSNCQVVASEGVQV